MNDIPETVETVQYDVNLPNPRPRKILIGVLVTVLVLGVIGVAAAAIANRTAQGQTEATAAVMPPNTMMYFSLNTQASQLPNFNAIADAWKDSKEAKMLASGLELAFSQTGLNWEDDVQPWLGERVAVGIVDLGGAEEAQADGDFNYRTPFIVFAVQTKDRAKSDAALEAVLKQVSQGSGEAPRTENYRDIPITYLDFGGSSSENSGVLATINDVIVLTMNADHMKAVIDAALDGQNLASSANYKAVMSALPDQNAGALYMDFPGFMTAYMNMITGFTSDSSIFLFCEYEAKSKDATPDADCVKQRQAEEQRRAAQQRQLETQMQDLRDVMQAYGGLGMAMSYEQTGIRFDTAAQFDMSKLPEKARANYANQTPASGKIFLSIPASAIVALNANMQKSQMDEALDLDQLSAQFAQMGVSEDEVKEKLAEFQQLAGVDLKTDLLDLIEGEAAFIMLPRAAQTKSEFGFSLPFQFAAVMEATDAAKAVSSLDKVLQAASTMAGEEYIQLKNLSGLPYSVLIGPDGAPMFTYGVVDGRFVIGTDSNTLLAIDNADQAPLASDATFKQATELLPGNRVNTFYMNFVPLWNLVDEQAQDGSAGNAAMVFNYLKHFKWMSAGSELSGNGVEQGSLHIGVGQ